MSSSITGLQERRLWRLSTFGLVFFALVAANLLLPRLGIFLLSLPIYFHALLFMSLGLWCWAVNIHVLTLYGIDCHLLLAANGNGNANTSGTTAPDLPKLMANPSQNFLQQHVNDYRSLYKISGSVSLVVIVGVVWYQLLHPAIGDDGSTFIPSLIYIILLGTLVWPGNFFYQPERYRFLSSLARITSPLLYREVPFCDVILADILTSFSRILGDLHVTFCDLVLEPSSSLVNRLAPRDWSENMTRTLEPRAAKETGNLAGLRGAKVMAEGPGAGSFWGFQDVIGPVIISLPFLIRFRQCISELLLAPTAQAKRRHLGNAIKYLSSLPVIFFSTVVTYLQRRVHSHTIAEADIKGVERSVDLAVQLWIVASVINAIYSLYWDVRIDWNLGYFRTPPTTNSRSPRLRYPFLRPILHFPSPFVYYFAILSDAAIRFAWFFKVYPLYKALKLELADPAEHTHHGTMVFVGLDLTLKLLEVLRRWMWTFLRIERDWIEKPYYVPNGDGLRNGEKERGSGEGVGTNGNDDFGMTEVVGGGMNGSARSGQAGRLALDTVGIDNDAGRKTRRTSWGEADGYGASIGVKELSAFVR